MARIRTIKPEFPHSESMGRVSRESRYCFILLWTIADDSGRLRGNSRMLASLLYPYDDDAPKHIGKWLDELERERCIFSYEVDGNRYIQICNWLIHQKIDRPSASKIPDPLEDSCIPREASRILVVGSKDQGPKDQGPKDDNFAKFWAEYPKKVAKGAAEKAWTKAKINGELSSVLESLAKQKRSPDWTKDGGKFIPHPATWINDKRWLDGVDESIPAKQVWI